MQAASLMPLHRCQNVSSKHGGERTKEGVRRTLRGSRTLGTCIVSSGASLASSSRPSTRSRRGLRSRDPAGIPGLRLPGGPIPDAREFTQQRLIATHYRDIATMWQPVTAEVPAEEGTRLALTRPRPGPEASAFTNK